MGSWRPKRNIEYLSRPPGQTEAAAATSTANRIKDAIKKEAKNGDEASSDKKGKEVI